MQMIPGLVGNIAVLMTALVIAAAVWRSSWAASFLLMPVAVWITLATIYLVKLIAVNAQPV